MKSKAKVTFGVFQDGLSVKVAQLTESKGVKKIVRLEEINLSKPLFTEESSTEAVSSAPDDIDISSFPDLEGSEDMEIPEVSEFDTLDEDKSVDETSAQVVLHQEFDDFIKNLYLHNGKIVLNTLDEHINYHDIDLNTIKGKVRKYIRRNFLSKEEIKDKSCTYDYIVNPDNTGHAFVHRGRFELLDALKGLEERSKKQKFFFDRVIPNEIALVNLVRYHYELKPDQYTLILYIGQEYKAGILMKGESFVKRFMIMVTETTPAAIRQAVFSKVILEQDTGTIPAVDNVIFAGDNASDEDIEYFKKKSQTDEDISRLTIDSSKLSLKDKANECKCAKFAIPIALALTSLDPKNKNFHACNLLPPKVIESQKYFKIGWHGFAVMVLIFFIAFRGTTYNLELNQELSETRLQNQNVERELRQNQQIVEKINQLRTELESINRVLEKIERITGRKNQWYYILHVLSQSVAEYPVSWFSNLDSHETGIRLSGYTTERRNVIRFSRLFPNGKIDRINEHEIQDVTLWSFNITYDYPDPETIEKEDELELAPMLSELRIPDNNPEEKVEQPPPENTPEPEVAEPTPTRVLSNREIGELYQSLVRTYFSGDIETAYAGFDEFRKTHNEHERSYNAYYFTGECLYLMQDYEQATEIFKDIVAMGGSKKPDALLMLGKTFSHIEDHDQAKHYFSKLIEEFPNSNYVSEAKTRLQNIGSAS